MKRRYKLLIGFIISGIILVLIFVFTKDRKIYYLSLGDGLSVGITSGRNNKSYGDYLSDYLKDKNVYEFYTKSFSNKNYRSTDLLNDLSNNKIIKINNKEISIKHALIKADIVTLSIGMNDLYYKLNVANLYNLEDTDDIYKYIDEVMIDINKLLYVLRKSCKEQIIVLGFYNPFINSNTMFSNMIEQAVVYANNTLREMVNKYDMTFVDLHDMFLANDNYLSKNNDIYPTVDGYYAIYKKIINLIDSKILAK